MSGACLRAWLAVQEAKVWARVKTRAEDEKEQAREIMQSCQADRQQQQQHGRNAPCGVCV